MLVEVMLGLGKMLVKWTAVVVCHIMTVGVNPQVGWMFTFPYILGFGTENAMAQIYTVFAFTVEAVKDI